MNAKYDISIALLYQFAEYECFMSENIIHLSIFDIGIKKRLLT